MKKKYILLSIAALCGLSSCSFLDEESYGSTTDIFNEENGLKAFVYQSYTKINNLYGESPLPLMTELGTDPGRSRSLRLLRA